MSDLAQAIVDLGKAAEDRRHARHDLQEATDVVADAIAKQLRTGDSITIGDGTMGFPTAVYDVRSVSWRVGGDSHSVVAALCRNGAVLGTPPSGAGAFRSAYDPSTFAALRLASGDERAAFALEAPRVVDGFTQALGKQAEKFASGAALVVQRAVRGPSVPRTGKWRNGPRDPRSPFIADVTFHPTVSPNMVSRVAQHFEVPVLDIAERKVVRFKVMDRDLPSAQKQAEGLVIEILNTNSGWRIEVHGPTTT